MGKGWFWNTQLDTRPDNWIVQSQATFVKLIPSTKKSEFGVHFLQLPTYTCQNEVKRAVKSGVKIGEKATPKGNWQLKNVFIFKDSKTCWYETWVQVQVHSWISSKVKYPMHNGIIESSYKTHTRQVVG